MSESRGKDDWRWIAILLGRVVGYSFIGLTVFGYAGTLVLAYIGRLNTYSTLLPGVLTAVLFGYAATRSQPRQSDDPDSQLLFNLVLWTAIVTGFGCVLAAITLSFVDSVLVLPEVDASWQGTFALIRPALVFLCLLGFQVLGVHMALVRVENKRKEAREGRSEIAN